MSKARFPMLLAAVIPLTGCGLPILLPAAAEAPAAVLEMRWHL